MTSELDGKIREQEKRLKELTAEKRKVQQRERMCAEWEDDLEEHRHKRERGGSSGIEDGDKSSSAQSRRNHLQAYLRRLRSGTA